MGKVGKKYKASELGTVALLRAYEEFEKEQERIQYKRGYFDIEDFIGISDIKNKWYNEDGSSYIEN